MNRDRAEIDRLQSDRAALVRALTDAGASVNDGDTLRCPFHDDARASGRIHKSDGAWRFYCMAGCGWNDGKNFGDVFDLEMKTRRVDFPGALAGLGVSNGNAPPLHANGSGGHSGPGEAPAGGERETQATVKLDTLAAENATRLRSDPAALARLWETRAIDAATAARFEIGIDSSGRYWTFPIRDDAGRVAAIKHHRRETATQPKCLWTPRGAHSRRLWPVSIGPSGPVWVAPGELKALALIAAARPAVGITGGESSELPDELAALLAGREVAIAPDDDSAGAKWAAKARDSLAATGLAVRIVNYGANAAAGLKDVGDVVRQGAIDDAKAPDEIGAMLDDAWARSDPWQPFTLSGIWSDGGTWARTEHIPTGLAWLDNGREGRDGLGGGLRVESVHLFAGKSARGKTQTVTQIALNAARADVPVGFISLELSRRDVGKLIAANLASVPRRAINSGTLGDGYLRQMEAPMREAERLPLTILDDDFFRGPITRTRLATIIRDGAARFGWKLIVLDYLGLLANEDSDRSDYAADVENSAALKRIAGENRVALAVVADVRKVGGKDAGKPMTLDDIRGAGRVVYDAVNVFGVDCEQARPRVATLPTGIIKLTALKTRFSGMGARGEEIAFRWYPEFGRVCDLDPGELTEEVAKKSSARKAKKP